MTPRLNKTEGLPDGVESDATQHISAGEAEQPGLTEPEDRRTPFSTLREAYARARDGRKRDQPEKQNRTAKSADRSKGLLVLAVAVIIMIFVFLGMFSSSSGTKDRAANRTKPSLGRPETATGAAEHRGSVTPLLNADVSGQDVNNDQLSADDVKATGRLRIRPPGETWRYARQRPAHGSGSGSVSPSEGWLPGSAASDSGRKRPGTGAAGCTGT
jgi:hypothetical protein